MERRKHPRVQLPLEIELSHPSIGRRAVVARDLTDEGLYAWYPDAPFKVGSAVDVCLQGAPMIESRPTPRVKMRVSRLDENGIVLAFINKSGAHLWRSADLTPSELTIGKDLFRVFQAACVRDTAGRLLTVQQNGRWLFPGNYLQAGEAWSAMLEGYLASTLNLTDTRYVRTVLTHNNEEVVARESSTMTLFHLYTLPYAPHLSHQDAAANTKHTNQTRANPTKVNRTCVDVRLSNDSPYSKARWIEKQRQLDELSFSAEPLRELARSLLQPEHRSSGRSSGLSSEEVLRKDG